MNNYKKQSIGVLVAVLGVALTIYLLSGTPQNKSQSVLPTPTVAQSAPPPSNTPWPTQSTTIPTPNITSTATPIPPTSVPPTSVPTTRTLSQSADYFTPRGSETINVSLTLDSANVIQNMQESQNGTFGTSAMYFQAFDTEIKGQVVGRKISDLNLSAVAGASLTTAGFMDAVNKIKSSI